MGFPSKPKGLSINHIRKVGLQNLRRQDVACLSCHFWLCGLSFKPKGLSVSHIHKVGLWNLHATFWTCGFPLWTRKRTSGKSRLQVLLQTYHATFWVRAFSYWTLEKARGKSHLRVVLQAHNSTFRCMYSHTGPWKELVRGHVCK